MGGRYLLGLKELYDTPLCTVELVAVYDLRRNNAEHLLSQAAITPGQIVPGNWKGAFTWSV